MTKSAILTLFILLSAGVHAQKTTVLKGKIRGLGNDSLIVVCQNLNTNMRPQFDTILANHDQFYYCPKNKSDLTEIILIPAKLIYHFATGRKYIPNTAMIDLVVIPGDTIINIHGEIKAGYIDYTVQGSEINKEAALIRQSYKELNMQAVAYEVTMANLTNDSNKINRSKKLFARRIGVTRKISEIKLNYIQSNLGSQVSAFFLIKQPIAGFGSNYSKLSQQVRSGPFKNALERHYQQYIEYTNTVKAEKKLKIGAIAPLFLLKDNHGNDFKLSSLKNKKEIIVLDFWGSWCTWCIEEFPKLKANYKKNKDNMEIIGIACIDTEENWKKSILEQNLPWVNLLDNNKINRVSTSYGVKAFPTKIILDSTLKIIGIYKGATPDFFSQIDRLQNSE